MIAGFFDYQAIDPDGADRHNGEIKT